MFIKVMDPNKEFRMINLDEMPIISICECGNGSIIRCLDKSSGQIALIEVLESIHELESMLRGKV